MIALQDFGISPVFQELANAMPQLVWVGVPDGSVIYINDKGTDFQGGVQKPDGSWDWQYMLHPDDLERTLTL
jgi:two-component system phosphate regulon sensor histidine kinase PhoR